MKYSVLVFPRIKVRLPDVEAESQEEALAKSVAMYCENAHSIVNTDKCHIAKYLEAAEDECDFVALVDECGDEEFENSQWYLFLGTGTHSDDQLVRMKGGSFERYQKSIQKFLEDEQKAWEKEIDDED
jgi:hypothetical protein